ncbi:MAG: cytochrome c [Acidobacteria bacterium]|nr:cytochrome c [Acidobacteriota bacterium]
MRWSDFLVMAVFVAVCAAAQAQSPAYGLGRTPSAEEIRAWDIAIGPEGKELPPGKGTAKEGATIYAARCAACHGQTGTEGPFNRLVGGQGTLHTNRPVKTVGSYWPFATTIWDYINRAMPVDNPGSLAPDQVYALTAFLLYRNSIIQETDVMDVESLPKVRMPNRNGFVPDPRPDWKAPVGGRN